MIEVVCRSSKVRFYSETTEGGEYSCPSDNTSQYLTRSFPGPVHR